MKNKIFIGFSVFIIIQSALYLSNIYAQGNFRERVRERIKEKWLEKKQAEDSLGVDDYHFSLEHGGIRRKYNVHLPPNYNKNVPTPVIIHLHGGGGSIKGAYQDGVDKAADKFGFILVIPAGTGPIPDKLLTWNGGKWPTGAGKEGIESCCGYAARNNIDDVGFISKMIEEVKNNFNVDENRIYATGISNGGMMSYRLACELSDKIAAIAPVAPPAVPANCSPLRPVPVMHIHGTADPCAPYDGGTGGGCLGSEKYEMQSAKEMVDIWKEINKCPGGSTIAYQKGEATCISYNKCAGDAEVELCTIEGGGHAWPSGSQYLPADRIGPVSYDISFEQIWEFFKRHPMKHSTSSSENSKVSQNGQSKRQKLKEFLSLEPAPYHPENLKTIKHNGLTRTYLLHIPPCYKKGTPSPLVFVFHGGGGTGEAAEMGSRLNFTADRECFIVVYPDGVSSIGIPGRRQYWSSGSGRTEERNPNIDDVGFVAALIDKLKEDYSIDDKRIYATGLSNGAQMCYRLACELSDKIAAIAPVGSGMVFENCQPKRPVPIIQFHGTQDPGWPYNGGPGCFTKDIFPAISETIEEWKELNQCTPQTQITYQKGEVTCETYTSCGQGAEITFCTIENGGHTWPGGYVFPSEEDIPWDSECALGKEGKGVGKVTQDIIAADAMWEFFKRHPLRPVKTDILRFGIDGLDPQNPQYVKKIAEIGDGESGLGGLEWRIIEPKAPISNKHSYTWVRLDSVVKEAQTAGRDVQVNLRVFSNWALELNPNKLVVHPGSGRKMGAIIRIKPYYLDDWAALVGALVERYDADGKDDMPGLKRPIVHIQIESEPDEVWASVDGLVEALCVAYKAAKEANPNVRIMAAGLNIGSFFSFSEREREQFLRDLRIKQHYDFQENFFKKGGKCFDILSLHLNRDYEGMPATIEWYRQQMNINGYQKPIWSEDTSSGPFLTGEPLLGGRFLKLEDEEKFRLLQLGDPETVEWYRREQSKLILKKAAAGFSAGLERIFFSTDVDWSNYFMPIWRNMGMLDSQGNPKPVFYMTKLMVSKLDGFAKAQKLTSFNDYIYKFEFRDKQPVFVLWSETGERTLDLSGYISSANVKVTHIITGQGETDKNAVVEVLPANSIKIGEVPIFVEQI